MPDSFFTLGADGAAGGGEWFQPTDHARGPWDPEACHAGPPTGLLARALERAVPSKRLARLTVDLSRPIPFAGFRVETEVRRDGRGAANATAAIVAGDGRTCVTATSMHIARSAGTPEHGDDFLAPRFADSQPGVFPISKLLHGLPGFSGTGVTVRYPPGEGPDPGPTVVWMRTISLLPGEEPSPFQRICPLSDCGNAFSRRAEPWEAGFVNTDLTIALHRDPEGEWLGMSASSSWHADGSGISDSVLFDERGSVGRAIQTLLITTPPAS